MNMPDQCRVCDAILEEFHRAAAEAKAEIEASPELRDELRTAYDTMLEKLRENVRHSGGDPDTDLEELFAQSKLVPWRGGEVAMPRHAGFREAFRKASVHRIHTGHVALIRK